MRLIKPNFVVETGCYLGDATEAIARGLKKNGIGKMITCDIEDLKVQATDRRIKEANLESVVQICLTDGLNVIKSCGSMIDFAFIDSGNVDVRKAEIKELLKHLRPGKMFCLHDTAPQHEAMRKMAQEIDLPKVYFNTPRGLMLFVKS